MRQNYAKRTYQYRIEIMLKIIPFFHTFISYKIVNVVSGCKTLTLVTTLNLGISVPWANNGTTAITVKPMVTQTSVRSTGNHHSPFFCMWDGSYV
jgi:hypothetical protein